MAKKFMYVCFGILALGIGYHFGAETASSQGTGTAVGIAADDYFVYVVTDCGDSYRKGTQGGTWSYWGNIDGAPSSMTSATWGQIKAEFGE